MLASTRSVNLRNSKRGGTNGASCTCSAGSSPLRAQTAAANQLAGATCRDSAQVRTLNAAAAAGPYAARGFYCPYLSSAAVETCSTAAHTGCKRRHFARETIWRASGRKFERAPVREVQQQCASDHLRTFAARRERQARPNEHNPNLPPAGPQPERTSDNICTLFSDGKMVLSSKSHRPTQKRLANSRPRSASSAGSS